ncbi:MAG: hypothetical protein JWO56_2082 [Acidobacteria bacterium]|nr:hypothetical protein [Acidobacteriota bacterium]
MARRTTETRTNWAALAFYGLVFCVVALIGGVAIWSFIEKQSLVIAPTPLPKVTVVTTDPKSPLAAAWITLLSKAEMQPTLVPIEKFDPIEGVVVFCDVPTIAPELARLLDIFAHRGGAVVFVGMPPSTPIGKLQLGADTGMSDNAIKLSEAVSPLLARLNPGYEVPFRPKTVSFLKESPRMVVDVRWKTNARAAVMHLEQEGARFIWIGIDPTAMPHEDRQLMLLLRTAFRWVAGQPVSDGAVGAPQLAKTLTPDARREARSEHFAFSVDPLPNPRMFSIRMTNRGGRPLVNPTVKVWLPPRVTEVALAGDLIMKRNATLTAVPEDGACLVSLPSLTRNEDRVMKLKIIQVKPPRDAERLAQR